MGSSLPPLLHILLLYTHKVKIFRVRVTACPDSRPKTGIGLGVVAGLGLGSQLTITLLLRLNIIGMPSLQPKINMCPV